MSGQLGHDIFSDAMRFRSALLLLVVATAAPLVLQSIFSALYVYGRENQSVLTAAKVRNRATLDAVDAQLRAAVGVLRGMAALPSLGRGDFGSFHDESRMFLETQPAWQNIILQRPDGRQLSNARIEWGKPLPTDEVPDPSFADALKSGEPTVSNLSAAVEPAEEPGVAVRVPVAATDRHVAYVITAVLRQAAFQQMLVDQGLPEGWASGIVGTDGRMIARVPEVESGRKASKDFLAATSGKTEGWFRGLTLERADTFTAFSRSRLTGWAIGYAIPATAVLGNSWDSATFLMAGTTFSGLFAVALGVWLTRRIAKPIDELAERSQAIGRHPQLRLPATTIHEIQQLSSALARTSDSILERDRQLERSRALAGTSRSGTKVCSRRTGPRTATALSVTARARLRAAQLIPNGLRAVRAIRSLQGYRREQTATENLIAALAH